MADETKHFIKIACGCFFNRDNYDDVVYTCPAHKNGADIRPAIGRHLRGMVITMAQMHDSRDTTEDMYFTSPTAIVHANTVRMILEMAEEQKKKRVHFTFGELTTVNFTINL